MFFGATTLTIYISPGVYLYLVHIICMRYHFCIGDCFGSPAYTRECAKQLYFQNLSTNQRSQSHSRFTNWHGGWPTTAVVAPSDKKLGQTTGQL